MKPSTKYLKITVNILSMAAIVAFCVWILPKILVFFMPFVIAAMIAMIANPLVRFLEQKLRIVRKAGTVVVIVLVLGIVVFGCYFVVAKLITEAVGFFSNAPRIWNSVSATFDSISDEMNILLRRMPTGLRNWLDNATNSFGDTMSEWISNLSTPFMELATNLAMNLPLIIVGIIMGILASYLFIAEKDYVISILHRAVPKPLRDRSEMVYATMKQAVGGYFKAQLKIMIFVFAVLMIGFAVLGVEYAVLLAVLIALLDFLPFFGTGAAMWPWSLVVAIQGNYKLAIGLMVVWALSQIIRQLIQPKMVGDSVGLEPIPTIFFLYIGFRVGGALGLIIAVPIGMIVINLYRAGVFSNFVYSLKLLGADLARLRRFDREDLLAEGIELTEQDEKASAQEKMSEKTEGDEVK